MNAKGVSKVIFNARLFWLLVLGFVSSLDASTCWPDSPETHSPQRQAEQHIRAALQANFQACNEENLEALMGTLSVAMDGREEFANEARTLFRDTDVYLRVADFELLEFRPPFASARVIQITLPANEKDRVSGDARQVFFRGNSALLPKWECVEYTQQFRKENGHWRLHLITTEPKPAVWPPDDPNAIRLDNMPAPNGSKPRSRSVFQ
ncbi:MAG: hypothetical protein WCC69_06620 [Pirellulales bacterium]